MEKDKNKFYIFLDFDGVLNDIITHPNLFKLGGFFVKMTDHDAFGSHTIEALNYLIQTLEFKYDVDLVLTTSWRKFKDRAEIVLKNNGLTLNGKIYKTPRIKGRKRIYEILDFLSQTAPDIDYLVIDDKKHIPLYLNERNYIKTKLWNNSLNISTVLDYLDKFHPALAKLNPLPDDFDFEK